MRYVIRKSIVYLLLTICMLSFVACHKSKTSREEDSTSEIEKELIKQDENAVDKIKERIQECISCEDDFSKIVTENKDLHVYYEDGIFVNQKGNEEKILTDKFNELLKLKSEKNTDYILQSKKYESFKIKIVITVHGYVECSIVDDADDWIYSTKYTINEEESEKYRKMSYDELTSDSSFLLGYWQGDGIAMRFMYDIENGLKNGFAAVSFIFHEKIGRKNPYLMGHMTYFYNNMNEMSYDDKNGGLFLTNVSIYGLNTEISIKILDKDTISVIYHSEGPLVDVEEILKRTDISDNFTKKFNYEFLSKEYTYEDAVKTGNYDMKSNDVNVDLDDNQINVDGLKDMKTGDDVDYYTSIIFFDNDTLYTCMVSAAKGTFSIKKINDNKYFIERGTGQTVDILRDYYRVE